MSLFDSWISPTYNNRRVSLLPTQLFNIGAREGEPFIFPPDVLIAHPPLPVNRRELGNLTSRFTSDNTV